MCKLGFDGFSVTIPNKQAGLSSVDEIDAMVGELGAMNTVLRREDGTLKGYNTNWIAAINAIEIALPNKSLVDRRVLCMGAEGAGRALAFGSLSRGAREVLIVNRSPARAIALAADIGETRAT